VAERERGNINAEVKEHTEEEEEKSRSFAALGKTTWGEWLVASDGEPRCGSDSLGSDLNAKEIRANGRKSGRILHLT
jgi:hypothetical protein